MNRFAFALFALATLLSSVSTPARAQFPYTPPTVSPYINLNRGGAFPGVNYYGIVRPEVDFRRSIQQLEVQTAVQQQAITGLQTTPGGVTTGHPAGFMTHLGYFQTVSRPGGPGGLGFGLGTGAAQPGAAGQLAGRGQPGAPGQPGAGAPGGRGR
jgi:hypothetical protein